MPTELTTERLLLRVWRDADREPFAGMNADRRVMEHFPSVQNREQSDAFVERIAARFARHGYGLWAVQPRDGTAEFVGFVGLQHIRFEAHFTPAVEIGWRLAHAAWGHGYATEAAHAVVRFAFDDIGLPELVSMTAVANERSRQVMRRLGMHHDPADDFDHPLVIDARVRRHVLYRLSARRQVVNRPL
jgi:ribosomal-protein-alanine N-acetyltransferase